MKRRILLKPFTLIIGFIIFNIQVSAQENVAFDKSNFKNDVEGFKSATKKLYKADLKYNAMLYDKALEMYLEVNKFNPNNARLNAKIGDCYLNSSDKSKAVVSFKKALSLNQNLDGYYVYLMGKSFHINNDFKEAIQYYKLSKTNKSKMAGAYINAVDRSVKECMYAQKLVKTPVNVEIKVLNEAINTENEEYVSVITADESEIFFTSRRKENIGGKMDAGLGDYFEDVYYSIKEDGKWTEAENVGEPINSMFHDATVGLSLDGQQLFFYRDNKKGVGNIFVTKRDGKTWTAPTELPSPINSKYKETAACYSYDGNTIYFVSDRPGGKGGKDIYKATKSKEGIWGEAENLGSPVNTIDNEDAVFLHPDGITLYFSSDGHQTMGGYDIFKTVLNKGRWSKPENIGYPVNTADDDVFFVLTASGNYGYYTSVKIDGKGKKDIFRVTFLDELNKPKLTLLKGIVIDRETEEKLKATIEIYDNDNKKTVGTFESNSATGKFMVSLPAGHNYGLSVKATGYLFYSENFNISKDAAFQEVEKMVKLDKLKVGNKVVLNNIFYDYNKATLSGSSFNELNTVIELMNANPKMKVELSAHSDSRGSDSYNLKLSQSRAQSCVDYLVGKGINGSRLVAKGYGEKQLVVTDAEIAKLGSEKEIEDAHQQNRRTEFKILEN